MVFSRRVARRNRYGISQPFTATAAATMSRMCRCRPRPMARGSRPSSTPWTTATWMALLMRLVATRVKLVSTIRAMRRSVSMGSPRPGSRKKAKAVARSPATRNWGTRFRRSRAVTLSTTPTPAASSAMAP